MKFCTIAGLILCIWGVAADLKDEYKTFKLVPDFLDNAPDTLLQVIHKSGEMIFGKEIDPIELSVAPKILMNFDPSSYYTLVFHDADVMFMSNDPEKPEYLHWLVTNIPGEDFGKGETIVQYVGSGPPPGTGLHRYMFHLFKQPGKMRFEERAIASMELDGREAFSIRQFMKKHGLADPIAGNMYTCQFNESIRPLLESLGFKFDR